MQWCGYNDRIYDDYVMMIFGNLSVVFRLLDIIIWSYMLQKRGGPLMVTAQYGYSSARVYSPKLISWGGYSSVFSPGWMVMTDCRKELGNRGGFSKHQEGIGKRVLAK